MEPASEAQLAAIHSLSANIELPADESPKAVPASFRLDNLPPKPPTDLKAALALWIAVAAEWIRLPRSARTPAREKAYNCVRTHWARLQQDPAPGIEMADIARTSSTNPGRDAAAAIDAADKLADKLSKRISKKN